LPNLYPGCMSPESSFRVLSKYQKNELSREHLTNFIGTFDETQKEEFAVQFMNRTSSVQKIIIEDVDGNHFNN
jgi:hypothetical protein